MRILSNIIIILALAMMLGAGMKILQTSWEFVLSFLLGVLVLWFGITIRPKRRSIKNKQNLNLKEG